MFTRSNSRPLRSIAACAALLAASVPAWAQEASAAPEAKEPEDCIEALKGGKVGIKLRYRFENVDQDGITDEAYASTLRTVLNYTTMRFHGFQIMLEFEDVSVIGDASYNDTINGSPRPVVADPEGTEINQSYLDYEFSDATGVRLGRQIIKLDNFRFIGDVAWRQNFQTFDAASASQALGKNGEVFVAYIENVNRVFGESSAVGDARMSSLLANANMDLGFAKIVGYWYDLDYDSMVASSTSTFGLRLASNQNPDDDFGLLYTLEAAMQADTGDNPNDVDADYYLGELGASIGGISLKLGFESLGGSTVAGEEFETPLATLHAHNGWADKFLSTPTGGLEDTYLSAKAKLGKTTCVAAYHDFAAETGSMDYGTELDISVTRPLGKNMVVGVKYANYMEDGFATDTEKIWGWLSLSL